MHVAVAAAWIGAGLVAWARHPELRIGPLIAAVGFAWEFQEPWWTGAFPGTVGYLLQDLSLAVGTHAILAFPSGRLQGRFERVLVAAAYATVLVSNLADDTRQRSRSRGLRLRVARTCCSSTSRRRPRTWCRPSRLRWQS